MEIFHIFTRGVEGREIFKEEEDYFRFIHDLYEFNNEEVSSSASYKFQQTKDPTKRTNNEKRKLIVNIHAFCLMKNHYHLLLTPKTGSSISKFMHRLNKGYSRYFNIKYNRRGTLFESRYKKVKLEKESHFIHILYYIHLNPLDYYDINWRNGELKNFKEAINFLNNYRWSSHLDYWGNKNFPSITQRNFFLKFFKGTKGYKESIIEWLKSINYKKDKNLRQILLKLE